MISLNGWLKDSKGSSTRSFQIPRFGTRSFSKIGFVPGTNAQTKRRMVRGKREAEEERRRTKTEDWKQLGRGMKEEHKLKKVGAENMRRD